MQQFHLLRHHQGAKLRGKSLGEVGAGEQCRPVGAAISVVLELPEMHELVDHAGIALEIADQVLVVPTLFDRRVAVLLIQPDRFRHLGNVQRVSPEFIECHETCPPTS